MTQQVFLAGPYPQPQPVQAKAVSPATETIVQSGIETPRQGVYGAIFAPGATLTVTVWNSVTSQSLTFQLWYVDPAGNLYYLPTTGPNSLGDMTSIANDRSAVRKAVTMPSSGGTIVSFSARVSQVANATVRGQTLVKAEVDNLAIGGSTSSTTEVLVLNYAYLRKDVMYPADDSIVDPTSGQGYVYFVGWTAIGTDSAATVPTNARWRFISISNDFTASSHVANRTIKYVIYQDILAATVQFQTQPTPAITNGQEKKMYGWNSYPLTMDSAYDSLNTLRFFFPTTYISAAVSPNGSIAPVTANMDVADKEIVNVQVEEWIEPGS